MDAPASRRPECFALLSRVFPQGPDGLRSSPEDCFACPEKTACLREALSGENGLRFTEERMERASAAGLLGFFERWSRKKSLSRRRANTPSAKK